MLNSTAIGTPTFTSKHSTEPNWNQKSFQKNNHILSNLTELLFQVTPIWKLKKLQKSLGHIIIAKGKRENREGTNSLPHDDVEASIPEFISECEFWLGFPNYPI